MKGAKKLIRITTIPISLEKLLENQLRFMAAYYDVLIVSSDKKYLEKVAETQGVKSHHVEMTRQITPVQDFKAVYHLYKLFKQEKPYIVHTHTPKAGITGMLAAKLAGVPHRLHTVAGLPLLEASGIKRTILNFVERLTYSCATNVYPNSVGLMKIIKNHNFCHDSKLKVLANGSSNGIDTEHFSNSRFTTAENTTLKKQLGISDTDFLFIFVGRLVADKGINELMRAFDKLSETLADVKLLLVGDYEPSLDPLLPETLAAIQRNPAVISTGWQSDVRPYFAISNALVFPTYREGFPNVVLQAGAMGLPCIVTDINGCNEIIDDGKNGIIIPVKNEKAIFAGMHRLYSDEMLYSAMQAEARPIIVSRYEQKVVWEAILQEYKTLEQHV